MIEELRALERMHTWDLVPLSSSATPNSCQWVYRVKALADDTIEYYKACLVALGFTQEYDIDYMKTLAPTAKLTTVLLLLAIATARH